MMVHLTTEEKLRMLFQRGTICVGRRRTINIQLYADLVDVPAVKVAAAGVNASVLHRRLHYAQLRGRLVHLGHLFLFDVFIVFLPGYFSFSTSWEGGKIQAQTCVSPAVIAQISNASPLQKIRTSAPTWKSCPDVMMSIFASKGDR